jgi:hypothetical protein
MSLVKIAALPVLGFICLAYGFLYGLTAPYWIVPLAVPILVLSALIIWALPDRDTAPTLGIEVLYPFMFVLLVLWPNYLAVSFPGMPWITAQRITGLPLAGFFLACLSVSDSFRRQMKESFEVARPIWICLLGLVAVEIFTVPLSRAPTVSAQTVFNHQLHFTMMFAIATVLFKDIRWVERYWLLLCLLAVPIVAITFLESSRQYILWAAHIPPILRVPDPSVELTLAPSFRAYVNIYRAKATFSTPLGLAEYMSLLTPFFLHFGLTQRRMLWKVASLGMLPFLFVAIRMTDARLGVAGFFVSVLMYGVFWSFQRWLRNPRDLLASAIMYAYPLIFAGAVGLIYSSRRVYVMVFGDGAQAGSTAARETQLNMALDKLWQKPWGHGASQSGISMGYTPGSFLTVDNYFITVALDFGVLGIVFWYGFFILAIVGATWHALSPRYADRDEARLLAPLAVVMIAFMVIKWVHGQDDNHSIYYMLVGMICALIYRLRRCDPKDPVLAHRLPRPRSADAAARS